MSMFDSLKPCADDIARRVFEHMVDADKTGKLTSDNYRMLVRMADTKPGGLLELSELIKANDGPRSPPEPRWEDTRQDYGTSAGAIKGWETRQRNAAAKAAAAGVSMAKGPVAKAHAAVKAARVEVKGAKEKLVAAKAVKEKAVQAKAEKAAASAAKKEAAAQAQAEKAAASAAKKEAARRATDDAVQKMIAERHSDKPKATKKTEPSVAAAPPPVPAVVKTVPVPAPIAGVATHTDLGTLLGPLSVEKGSQHLFVGEFDVEASPAFLEASASHKTLGEVLPSFKNAPRPPLSETDAQFTGKRPPEFGKPTASAQRFDELPKLDFKQLEEQKMYQAVGKMPLLDHWMDVSKNEMAKVTVNEAAAVANFSAGSDSVIRTVERSTGYDDAYKNYKAAFESNPENKGTTFAFSKERYNEAVGYAKDLEGVFAKATPTSMVTYRGMKYLSPETFDSMMTKDHIDFHSTTSTSIDPITAKTFATADAEHRGYDSVILKISGKSGVPIHSVSQFNIEHEMMFPKGRRFKVTGRHAIDAEGSGGRRMMMEIEEV